MPSGYAGRALSILERYGAAVGDYVRIHGSMTYTGTIMPRYHHSDDSHVVIKLDSGYNVGVSIDGMAGITVLRGPPDAAPAAAPRQQIRGCPTYCWYRRGAPSPAA